MTYKKNSNILSFEIYFPQELRPLYDYLQQELNFLLSDKYCRQEIESVDINLLKGKYWNAMSKCPHIRERRNSWAIKNKAWYSFILFENIRREVESKRESMIIWDELVSNSREINTKLKNRLKDKGVWATNTRIQNINRSKSRPEIADSLTLNLDYSISRPQMFTMDNFNYCRIQLADGQWLNYQILLPSSLNQNLTGAIAKPKFVKKNGEYKGYCSYEYTPETAKGTKILGVDLGKIKYFSAIAMDNNGNYSDEYIQSKRTTRILDKLSRIYNEKNILTEKTNVTEQYNKNTDNYTLKQERRIQELEYVSDKISRIKIDIAKRAANEIVQTAKNLQCNEIHLERLSWLESTGGKWNFSTIQSLINNKAKQNGIKVVTVSAKNSSKTNPVTQEIGKISNRTVKFSNGYAIDRDVLAAINLSLRTAKSNNKTISKLKKKHNRACKVKTQSRRKEIRERLEKIKRNTQIVVFCPSQADYQASWCPIYMDLPNTSLLIGVSSIRHFCINK